MACKLSTHADAYPNTLPWPKVARCPHLTGIPAFPRSSAVAANVGSSRCSHAPMQHAAAHQQAVLHQGVVVEGISPFIFWDYIWVLSICVYIYTDRYLSISWNIYIYIIIYIYISIYLSIYLSTYLSIYPSIHPYIYIYKWKIYIYINETLVISREGADRWFCREKGSREYKSIQESGSKCTTKYKSREPKMAAHYKIQNKDHEKPPNKGCLENRLEKKLLLPRLESAQNRLCGVCSGLYFVENPPWSILNVLKT